MTYSLTYMALQPRFDQCLSEKISPLYSITSEVHAICLPARPYKGLSVVSPRNLLPCAQCSTVDCSSRVTTPMTCELLNSLSSSKLYLLLYTPSTIFGPYIVRGPSSQRRAIGTLSFLSALTFHCRTASGRIKVLFIVYFV
jgi:hypothetical protein